MTESQSQARVLRALAHPTRLRLLQALRSGEQCVCHLTALLGQRQAYVSQQLMFLRRAGLLQDRKEGARVYYRIKDKSLLRILQALDVTGSLAQVSLPKRLAACSCPRCVRAHKANAGKAATRRSLHRHHSALHTGRELSTGQG